MDIASDEPDYTIPKDTSVTAELAEAGMSAKDRHRAKVSLKAALKVKVASLKQARAKLTKAPGNTAQRKEVSAAKQAALMELKELQKPKAKAEGGAAAGAGEGSKAGKKKKKSLSAAAKAARNAKKKAAAKKKKGGAAGAATMDE
ncbi:hypothetical protein HYH03_010179 [Edaphochlamys debaryana]|uniref:Uncharacterized protein n=1 Tax=Edaphochlamys debaryana TaxID=47281 RepID=A0A835XWA4_9CHLO|nr:hypothetical protein HYH03_010179 [Edaphochlamys debaryana]|eukprot:KAG2491388.1 hypothetical protein HYH03_010179 [Edaphochlamys debaryana]